jgi:hypothetical protein
MRLAREAPKLDGPKWQRVADLSLRDALAALSTDARNLVSIPAPERERVLDEADGKGLSRPLKQRINHLRYEQAAEKREQEVWATEVITPRIVLPPAPKPLVEDLIAVCRKHAAEVPDLSLEEVLEALSETYTLLQASEPLR